MDLEEIRKKIDAIDSEMTALFEQRMKLAFKVAKFKERNSLPIFHPVREKEVIAKNIGRLKDQGLVDELQLFYQGLMDISKSYQKKALTGRATVGYQGVDGSFSSVATEDFFEDEKMDIKLYKEFKDVFEALKKGEIDYGVVPIENSTTGTITENVDLLSKYDVYILEESLVRAKQNLLGIKGSDIEKIQRVFSHPQGFEQSTEYLAKHPNWEKVPFHNTAISAEHVAKMNNPHMAAIASQKAAKIYGLEILAKDIADNRKNFTRFLKLGRRMLVSQEADKVTMVFSVSHIAGSLGNVIKTFSDEGINILSLESRPIQNKPWEYYFFVDLEGNLASESIKKAVGEMSKYTTNQKILGCYKREVF